MQSPAAVEPPLGSGLFFPLYSRKRLCQKERMQNSLANVAVAPRPETQVDSQLSHLSKSSAEITSLLVDLENKLDRVLRQQQDQTEKPNSSVPPEEYLVPHADSIRAIRKVAECNVTRLQSILNRIEA